MDIWSIGGILIEAAVWVVFGERGRVEFQERRKKENTEKNRALGRGDCFHDGSNRLESVVETFDLIRRHGRRSDGLTPEIVNLVLDHVLVDQQPRYNARLLYNALERLTSAAEELSVNLVVRAESTASSADHNRRSQLEPSRSPSHTSGPLPFQRHIDRAVTTQSMSQRLERVQGPMRATLDLNQGMEGPWSPMTVASA